MRATAAVLVTALVAAGCTGGGEPVTSGPASPTATATHSADPTTGPATDPATDPVTDPVSVASPTAADSEVAAARTAPSPPPARNDREGRTAFAEYVLQAWIYALNTNDPQALLDVSGDRPCEGCEQLRGELEKRSEEGWYVELEDVRVASARSRETGTTSRVLLSVSLPESDTFYDDGSFRSTNPAHPRSTFEVEMTFTGKQFHLDAFSLY